MARYFYFMVVTSFGDKPDRFFRILSGLDGPAPVLTDIFLTDEKLGLMDHVSVTSHGHVMKLWPSVENTTVQVGDFHSRLDVGRAHIDYDALCSYLLTNGWEEVPDYL